MQLKLPSEATERVLRKTAHRPATVVLEEKGYNFLQNPLFSAHFTALSWLASDFLFT